MSPFRSQEWKKSHISSACAFTSMAVYLNQCLSTCHLPRRHRDPDVGKGASWPCPVPPRHTTQVRRQADTFRTLPDRPTRASASQPLIGPPSNTSCSLAHHSTHGARHLSRADPPVAQCQHRFSDSSSSGSRGGGSGNSDSIFSRDSDVAAGGCSSGVRGCDSGAKGCSSGVGGCSSRVRGCGDNGSGCSSSACGCHLQ